MNSAFLILITNVMGWGLGLVMIVLYILHAKKKLKPKPFAKVLAIFAIAGIVYGVYVLFAAQSMRELFPKEHYPVGAGIVILIGILILVRLVLERRSRM